MQEVMKTADCLTEPVAPEKAVRNYDATAVMAHIDSNRLPDGSFKVKDYVGAFTVLKQEFKNLVPDETSKVYEHNVHEALVVDSRNAFGSYRRAAVRLGGPKGFGRVLFIDEIDEVPTLCINHEWVNLPPAIQHV